MTTADHVCKPGATTYYCPTAGEVESDCHGGFDTCCDRPDLHRPINGPDLFGEVERLAAELYQSEDARAWVREQCAIRERNQKASPGQGEVQTGEVLAWLEGPKCGRRLSETASTHTYLATGCLHGEHAYCQGKTGKAGAKKPAECKFCEAPRVCGCHQE